MTTKLINQLLTYLNQYTSTKIRPIIQPILAVIDQGELADDALDDCLREALEKSAHPFVALEYAEIKLHGGVAWNLRRQYGRAQTVFGEALEKLDGQEHHQLIALWMAGQNALDMDEQMQAYLFWSSARDKLEDILTGQVEVSLKKDMPLWYMDRNLQLNQLMAVSCIQEIYHWYDVFEADSLDGELAVLSKSLLQAVADHKETAAQQLSERLMRVAGMDGDFRHMRSALVLCGIAQYLMPNPARAADIFSQAAMEMEPRSKRQAVVYWMQGLAQWAITDQRDAGLGNLEKAAALFRELQEKADKKHLTPLVHWYGEKLEIMAGEVRRKQQELAVG